MNLYNSPIIYTKEIWILIKGIIPSKLIDANDFHQAHYQILNFDVNDVLYQKVRSNGLWVRTVDTGRWEGRAGIYVIRDFFGVDGIMVSKATYRTHPIQLFFDPPLNERGSETFTRLF